MADKRLRRKKTEYEKKLRHYHSVSNRHVLVLEAEMSETDKRHIFADADLLRQCGNQLIAVMKIQYEQLIRTKQYRILKKLYENAISLEDDAMKKNIGSQMQAMQEQYHVTWEFCRTSMIRICKDTQLNSIFALTKAEDVWRGIETILYRDGEALRFKRRGNLPNIRAKQTNRGIIVSVKDGDLMFKYGNISFSHKAGDRFVSDEISAITRYLEMPEVYDRFAVDALESNELYNTYRPCFVSLVCKTIRGKLRVYIHITTEGIAFLKYNKDGALRHQYGSSIVGCDIGTQTIAYTSDSEVGLKNLAERGRSIENNERMERILYQKMDRSRRAMNPENYNDDGTIRKGKKVWRFSKRYMVLKARHAELCRINAESRHFSINEDVNHLRSLGDCFVTEPKNAARLMKKAKKDTVREDGKHNRRKRFGKSVKNRCPGYFQKAAEQKFLSTGGRYIEVDNNYRASQYDHTIDDYIKKKLSDRMYCLADGTKVQRDWYSSFLLYCIEMISLTIDKEKCQSQFASLYRLEVSMIDTIRNMEIKVMNSGIR